MELEREGIYESAEEVAPEQLKLRTRLFVNSIRTGHVSRLLARK